MKKVILMVALFLVGTATQTMANHQNNVDRNPVKRSGCNLAEKVQFVEQGVLYTVTPNGSFDYKFLREQKRYRQRARYNTQGKRTKRYRKYRNYRPVVTTDRFGRIRSIGQTQITYKRNGKVRSIGSVPMQYHRGRLVQVGSMELIYNRFGTIRHTIGHVNKFNKRFWHDDWYVYNNRYEDDDFGYRRRTK